MIQAYHLGCTVGNYRQDDQQVHIAVRACRSTTLRTEEYDPGGACCLPEQLDHSGNRLVVDHALIVLR